MKLFPNIDAISFLFKAYTIKIGLNNQLFPHFTAQNKLSSKRKKKEREGQRNAYAYKYLRGTFSGLPAWLFIAS
jgi:hypothetical protein